ncbi:MULTISPECIES: hypothetical protein [Sphingobium]|jgi:hypothetical protein|uniref:Uncharacterized protein n=1 Tax=Sphingobium yanoikuyae TaxID=13690 RepID=A0A3G2UUF1_SPHYA|nr:MULTISPECIES: hypothetical protein [Sphingobium]AYO76379.1 hypothetical protein EBF16_05155 [Sphingobium yanoikuyae]PZU65623.1 MAG: hypothetical protein DI540_16100 [Sphingobium sp.]QNG46434.1 hypothetical protein H3V42_01820 [Sphingobium yanoikuyae]
MQKIAINELAARPNIGGLRPILMFIFAVLVYKVAKLFIATNKAVILSFSSNTDIFIIELVSIQMPALQFASMLSRLVGAGLLAMIFGGNGSLRTDG